MAGQNGNGNKRTSDSFKTVPLNCNGVLRNIIVPIAPQELSSSAKKKQGSVITIGSDGQKKQLVVVGGDSNGQNKIMLVNQSGLTGAKSADDIYSIANDYNIPTGHRVVRMAGQNSSGQLVYVPTSTISTQNNRQVSLLSGQTLLSTSQPTPVKLQRHISSSGKTIISSQTSMTVKTAPVPPYNATSETYNPSLPSTIKSHITPHTVFYTATTQSHKSSMASNETGLKIQSVYTLANDDKDTQNINSVKEKDTPPSEDWPSGIIEIKPDDDDDDANLSKATHDTNPHKISENIVQGDGMQVRIAQQIVQQLTRSNAPSAENTLNSIPSIVPHSTRSMNPIIPQTPFVTRNLPQFRPINASAPLPFQPVRSPQVGLYKSASTPDKPTLTVLGPPGISKEQVIAILAKQPRLPAGGTVILGSTGVGIISEPSKMVHTENTKPITQNTRSETQDTVLTTKELKPSTDNANTTPRLPSRPQVAKKSTGRKRRQLDMAVVGQSRKKLKAFRAPDDIEFKGSCISPCRVLLVKLDQILTKPVRCYDKKTVRDVCKFERRFKKKRNLWKKSTLRRLLNTTNDEVSELSFSAAKKAASALLIDPVATPDTLDATLSPGQLSTTTAPVQTGDINKNKYLMVKTSAGTFLVPFSAASTISPVVATNNISAATAVDTGENVLEPPKSLSPAPPVLTKEDSLCTSQPVNVPSLETAEADSEVSTEPALQQNEDDETDSCDEGVEIVTTSPVLKNSTVQPTPFAETREERIKRLKAQLMQTKVECEGVTWSKENTKEVLSTLDTI